ncbi:MAG TPA: periplasmic heavy metal sensor [Thermoanaerobaculia bacterium]
MKNPRILTAVILTALVAALALPALAPAGQTAQVAEAARPNPVELLNNPRALARYLRLTPEQLAAFRQLRQELQNTVEPLREQQRDLREQLRDQLEASSPDACAIGETSVDIHELGEQIRAAVEHFDEQFSAILTPAQLARYEALKELARQLRGGEDDE